MVVTFIRYYNYTIDYSTRLASSVHDTIQQHKYWTLFWCRLRALAAHNYHIQLPHRPGPLCVPDRTPNIAHALQKACENTLGMSLQLCHRHCAAAAVTGHRSAVHRLTVGDQRRQHADLLRQIGQVVRYGDQCGREYRRQIVFGHFVDRLLGGDSVDRITNRNLECELFYM